MIDEMKDYILAHTVGNLYWKNRKGEYLGCNNNMANICRLNSPEEILDKTDYDLLRNIFSEQAIKVIALTDQQIMECGVERVIEENGLDAKGNVAHYMSYKIPIRDSTGAVVGLIGASVDITKQRRAEAVKKEFLDNMRHDIRTPLAGIVGFARIIKDESNEPKIKEYVDNLLTASDALFEFLNAILETIRLDSGEIQVLKNKFNLKKYITEVIDLNQAKARQKRLDLQLDYDAALPAHVIGDAKRIQRIVLELITNALNFTDTGSIKVAVQLAQDQPTCIKIIVSDTGIGIPLEQQQEIFTRFKRLTPAYEGKYKGAGLGLALVKQFMADLDAEIEIESEVGKGTVFTCVIPMELADHVEAGLLNETVDTNIHGLEIRTQSEKWRVLLVEDDLIATKMAQHILQSLNCHIDHAPDGQTALTLASEHHYDLIFMDIGLPDISGLEVTQRIRANMDVPIVALTAHVEGEDKQRCIEAGMHAVLAKPLVKEKAEDIFNMFIRKQPQETHITQEINSEIAKSVHITS